MRRRRPADAILDAIFRRYRAHTSDPPQMIAFIRDTSPNDLFLKACEDGGALYLDARSNRYRATRRCPGCFARQRYRYVQRARSW